jgi:hypothetical protein
MAVYKTIHNGIEFGSTNPQRVNWFKSLDLTVDAIKQNTITNRHSLMLQLACAGHCQLANDYFHARELHYRLEKEFKSMFDKNRTTTKYKGTDMFIWDAARQYAIDQTFSDTGFLFE